MNPKVQYIDRKCTLCNDNDIQDEYHIVLKCAYYNEVRRKYIKPYYHRHPSMYKFQELMNRSNNCIVLYCIMRPYTDGPIGPLSYRHSSGVVRNPHSTLAE